MGYHRAGFEVVGVDIAPQPHYPFEFHQADALTFLNDTVLRGPFHENYGSFDAIHASPPCQAYTTYAARSSKTHPDLIETTRELLRGSGLRYVIENVPGAPLLNAVTICGTAFAELRVRRHRLFESKVPMEGTACNHDRHPANIRIMNRGWKMSRFVPVYGSTGCKARELWPSAMGIDWMSNDELREAIPPAYTEWVGAQLLASL